MRAESHPDEARRLEALRAYGVLDTDPEREFDDLVALAARICETPISVVNLIDAERQWFKAEVGLGVRETPIDSSICAHAILRQGVVEVSDTALDPRFWDNPLVTGEPGLRFYAGALLQTEDGLPLGTLCVLDTKPRTLTDLQRETLRVLGGQVMARLELRRKVRELEAEKAARSQDEAFLRLVTDKLPVRIGYLDREYRYRFMNGEYERAFGFEPGTSVGMTVAEYAGEEAFLIAKPFLDRALAGDTHTQEFTVPYAFGTRRVEVQYVADRDEKGEVRGIVLHVSDVTERHAMTEAVRAREERYRTLFDSLEEGFCVFEMIFDESGRPVDYRFREINAAFTRQTGLREEDVLGGKTIREMVPTHEQAWFDRYGRVATTGEPLTIEDRAEGFGRWYSIHAFRIGGEGSREVGALFKDMTEARAAQLAIEEERTRQDRTLENAEVATFDWDVAGDRVYANPLLARFFGVSDADADGGPIAHYFAAIHADDRERTGAAIGASLSSGQRYEVQYRLTDAKGRERVVLARGDTILGPDGKPLRLSGVVLDVTARERAEQARRESERRVRAAFDLLEGIIEGTSEVMVAVDRDFRFTAMNEAFRGTIRHLFGKTPEVGGDLLEVVSDVPEDHARTKALWERALGGEEVSLREAFGDPGHARSVFDLRFYPIRNAAGEIVGAAEIARDVTERAEAEAERERLLAELEVEREKLRTIFEQAPAIIAVLRGRELVFDYVNQGYYQTTGHRPMIGLTFEQALPEASGGGEGRDYDRVLRHVFDTGERLIFDARPVLLQRVLGAESEERFLDLAYQPLREANGTISGVLVHGIDVTDQVRARRAIGEREELFRTVFEQAPDDAILVMDENRTLTAWNPAAERIAGWTAAEAVGQPADLIFTPEDRAAGAPEGETSAAAREGKSEDERWHLRKDGSRFWGSGTMNALHGDDGQVRGYLKVFRDTTERYEETQTLAFLSLLTEAVVDQRDVDAILDTAGRMTGQYLGASRVIFAEVEPDEEGVVVLKEWALDARRTAGTQRLPEFGPRAVADYRSGTTHVSYDASRDEESGAGREALRAIDARAEISVPILKEGRLSALFIVHNAVPRDWTSNEIGLVQQVADRMSSEIERARAELALRNANQTLEARVEERTAELQRSVQEAEGFNYSISHDLRTPLRAMVSTSSILLEEIGPELSEDHREMLERQVHNARRLGVLIDELLRLSRLARVPVNRVPLDMTAKALSVAEEIRQSGESGPCRVEVQDGMTATGDPGLVRTVLHNLIGNACKFSPGGGAVWVGSSDGTFFVRDEGVGFDMKYAPKVFLPFERLVLESEFPGTGIGLANVKRIVERHGGRVWVESAPRQGATFFFTLEPVE